MKMLTWPDTLIDRVTGIGDDKHAYDLTITEFMKANPIAFNTRRFTYEFLHALAAKGRYDFDIGEGEVSVVTLKIPSDANRIPDDAVRQT